MKGPEKLAVNSYRKGNAAAERVSLQWSTPTLQGTPPCARGGHSAVLAGTHLLIFGGHYFGSAGGFVYLNDLHRLDLETSSWGEIIFPKTEIPRRREQFNQDGAHPAVLPAPRYGHSALLLNNGERMFIFGGRGAQAEAFRDMFFFDCQALTWFQVQWITDCPLGRFGHAAASVDDEEMFIFGGWDGKKSMNDLWSFNSSTFTWRRPKCTGKPPTPRHNLSMVGLVENGPPSLLLYGGYTVMSEALPVYNNDVYIFDIQAFAWSRPRLVGEYPLGTFGHSLNLVGAVSGAELAIILGGWSGTERTPIFMGDKQVREFVRQEEREHRLVSSNNQREETQQKRERKKQHERDLRGASSYTRVLDVQNMEWHRVTAYGVAVATRYGHTSTLVGPHLFLFGGWDGNRALNQLVVGELSISPEPETTEAHSPVH